MKLAKCETVLSEIVQGHAVLRIPVTVNNVSCRALIDTAASHNFINPNLVNKADVTSNSAIFQLATKDVACKNLGETNIIVKIRDVTTVTNAIVMQELREDVILGSPWLIEQNAVIEMASRRVHFGIEARRTVYNLDPRPSAREVNLDEFEHEVPPAYRDAVQRILDERRDVFSASDPLRRTDVTKHYIPLTSDTPIYEPPRRYYPHQMEIIRDQIREMLDEGVIEPTNSKYNSAITLAPKKDGTWRFCVDFRPINKVTQSAPPPYIQVKGALSALGNAKIMTSLDLRSGYWQIEVAPEDRHKTAFTAPDGRRFQFCSMPFGLKCAPSTFQTLMVSVLDGYIGEFALAYLDDVIIWSATWEDHVKHLALVLERLAINGLTCANRKCHIGKAQVKFLGHLVDEHGSRPTPDQLALIDEYPVPSTRKQVRKFFGLINWLREFIRDFATVTAPLTDLLSPAKPFRWSVTHQHCFEEIKIRFQECPQLARHDPLGHLYLQTDASELGIGAVLYQINDDGERRIIDFSSAKLGPVERRYDVNERECLAAVWAIKRYRQFLEYQRFTLRTDNRCLVWLHSMCEARSKLTRWSRVLQSYDFNVEHVPGAENELPDALSRAPQDVLVQDDEGWDDLLPPSPAVSTKPDERMCDNMDVTNGHTIQTLRDAVLQAQTTCPTTQKWIARCAQGQVEHWRVINGRLEMACARRKTKWKLFVPTSERENVLAFAHSSAWAGHPGGTQTTTNVQKHFHWKGATRDIRDFVRRCELCNHVKSRRGDGVQQQQPRYPTTTMDTVALDVMGPYPRSKGGKRFIIVVTDLYTRWVEAYAVASARTSVIAQLLDKEFFPRWGYPRVLLSDNGSQFTGRKWREHCTRWGVQPQMTAVYHPRANPTERRNQELKTQLRLRVGDDHTTWAEHLPAALFAVHSRVNAATNKSPAEMMQGRELTLPGEMACFPADNDTTADSDVQRHEHRRTQREVRDHQMRYVAQWCPQSQRRPCVLRAGDKVYARSHPQSAQKKDFCAGLARRWTGPHTIIRTSGDTCYIIRIGRRYSKVHRDDIRLAEARPDTTPPTTPATAPNNTPVSTPSTNQVLRPPDTDLTPHDEEDVTSRDEPPSECSDGAVPLPTQANATDNRRSVFHTDTDSPTSSDKDDSNSDEDVTPLRRTRRVHRRRRAVCATCASLTPPPTRCAIKNQLPTGVGKPTSSPDNDSETSTSHHGANAPNQQHNAAASRRTAAPQPPPPNDALQPGRRLRPRGQRQVPARYR